MCLLIARRSGVRINGVLIGRMARVCRQLAFASGSSVTDNDGDNFELYSELSNHYYQSST